MSSYPSRRRQRLAGYDYTSAGCYFVTLCIEGRLPLLGRITAAGFESSPAGAMVHTVWETLPDHVAGVTLDTLIIMPDHLHAIVVLAGEGVSLSSVIRRFKSYTTARYATGVHQEGWPPFQARLWQMGFHDRIVRDERELTALRTYVVENPLRWWLRQASSGAESR